jgi:hypothetical protein
MVFIIDQAILTHLGPLTPGQFERSGAAVVPARGSIA